LNGEETMPDYSNSYDQFETELRKRFAAAEYDAVIDLARSGEQLFPDMIPNLLYWKACALARLQETDEVLYELNSALKGGLWLSQMLLRNSPSFQPLQGQPDFEDLASRSAKMETAAHNAVPSLLVIKSPTLQPPYPIVLALHENASTNQIAARQWAPVATNGWMLALPRSSVAAWKDAYSWTESAEDEVMAHYESLKNSYALDERRLILAGSSMGASVAVQLALSGKIPAKKIIAVNPYLPDIEEWQFWENPPAAGSLTGYVFAGADDQSIPLDKLPILVEKMNAAGLSCRLEIIPGLDHRMPEDWVARLPGLLKG